MIKRGTNKKACEKKKEPKLSFLQIFCRLPTLSQWRRLVDTTTHSGQALHSGTFLLSKKKKKKKEYDKPVLGAWPKFLSLVWLRLTLSRSAPHLSATVNFRHPPPPRPHPPDSSLPSPLGPPVHGGADTQCYLIVRMPDCPGAHTPSIAFWHLPTPSKVPESDARLKVPKSDARSVTRSAPSERFGY